MEKKEVPFKDLELEMTRAILRLMDKHPRELAYVIVDHEDSGSFLQFANTVTSPVVLDVPIIGVQRPCRGAAEAAGYAMILVDAYWPVDAQSVFRITEDEQRQGRLRRRLVRWGKRVLDRLCPLAPVPA